MATSVQKSFQSTKQSDKTLKEVQVESSIVNLEVKKLIEDTPTVDLLAALRPEATAQTSRSTVSTEDDKRAIAGKIGCSLSVAMNQIIELCDKQYVKLD